MRRIWFGASWGLLAAIGCGAESGMRTEATVSMGDAKSVATPAPAAEFAGMMGASTARAPGANTAPPKALPRKIIYNSDVSLIVENFDRTASAIAALIKNSGGYLADSDITGSPGSNRRGMWKVRVPVEGFDGFVESVVKLGELVYRKTNSQDVSEEFYDLDARIKNKKIEEGRLVKHLEESTGKLSDILEVEKEISRVREEIERQQGRLNMLANLTSLTTVTIIVEERKDYVPPANPTFAQQIALTFQQSVDNLAEFGKAIVLFVVALAPWLPLILLVALIVWLIARRAARQLNRPRPSPWVADAGGPPA